MIQPVSPSPLPATGLPGDVAALPLGEAPAGPDFGALLALEGLAASPPVGEAAPLPAAAVLVVAPANPGKILPSALPETANLPADLAEPEPTEPAQSAPPVLATAVQLPVLTPAKAGKAEAKPTKSETIAPEDKVEAGAAPSTAAPLPVVLPVEVAPVTVLVPAPAAPEVVAAKPKDRPDHPEAEPEPVKEHTNQSALHRTIPTLPATASDQARAQMLRHTPPVQPPATEPVTTQPIPTEPEAQAAQAPAPQSRAVPAEEIRVELALPRLAAAAARTRDETQPLPKWAELTLSDATPAATSAQPLVNAPAPISPAPQVRPHDFAALIERIAVAREAVAPQAVSITLSHQDFGQVRLNFRPEGAGLSVSMTSPDPDFARAAAAMPAPVLPVAQSEQAALSQHQRSDGGQAQSGGQTQSRGGGASEQRRDGQPQPQPQSHSHPRGRGQNSAARAGIFA